ncbi:hypothetical protein JCM3766R1_002512 [Sporobolomyces carnicolor]
MAPKRPADAYTPSAFPTDRATTSVSGKRTRFAPPNASTVLGEPSADDLELDLEGTGGTQNSKRNKVVVTDGYDSDSSGGGDDDHVRRKRRHDDDSREKDDDDDEDMFGGGTTTQGDDKSKGKERDEAKKEWLEMGDIEGQEFSKRDMRDDDQGDDDEDDDDELEEDYDQVDDHANDDDAPRSRRSKKGMGFQLSSFNMKEELAEGRFSADGSYVANSVDPLANHDSWLTGLSKVEIRRAREAKERMDVKNRERERDEQMRLRGDEQLTQLRDDCLIGLVADVRPGETVAQALNRLGRNKKRAEQLLVSSSSSSSRDTDAAADNEMRDVNNSNKSSEYESSIKRYTDKINRLTHFASTLLSSHGELEIYDESHEDIVRTLKMEGAVRRDWQPASISHSDADREIEQREERESRERERCDKEEEEPKKPTTREGRSRVVISRPTAAPTTTTTTVKYWYRWNPAPAGQDANEQYGPFGRTELEDWIRQGFFGDQYASRILVRKEGDDPSQFKTWNEVVR